MLQWICGILIASLAAHAANAAAPLSAYGRLPAVEDVAMSASGKKLALVVTDGEERYVAVQDLGTGKLTLRAKAGQSRLRDIRFVGETHLIVITQVAADPAEVITRQREWWVGTAIDIQTGRTRPLMDGLEGAMNVLIETPEVRMVEGEPRVLAQGIRFENGVGRVSLFELDLQRARAKLRNTGDPDTRRWIVGPDGAAAAEERFSLKSGRWSLHVNVAGVWREAISQEAGIDPPRLLGFSPDGRALLFGDNRADGSWKSVNMDRGLAVADFGKSGLAMRDHRTGRLTGTEGFDGERRRYEFFDPADVAMWRTVERAFPDSLLALMTRSEDRQRIIVEVDSPTEGLGYALVDRGAKRATWLGESYPALTPADISERKPIRYKAADGLELPGFLTLPRGREAKGLPPIVFPHGGPESMDGPGFDWWAQAMASRGYAVLQVNFRGSSGLGSKHLEAGYGQWGRKMQTDLSDGVRHLAGQGIIDPRRVCIVGASYGGYAALAGVTLDRGAYRCAVSVAGIADLPAQIAFGVNRPAWRYWTRYMGAEGRNDPVLKTLSPLNLADRAEAPILLIHGKDDTVVPVDQSRRMAEALSKAGKPVELIVHKGGDHWLSRGDTRLETLTATMAFVEKHNPPN